METREDTIPVITLGGFKFADQQAPPGQTTNEKVGTTDNTKDYVHPGNPPGLDFRRPEAYERMATDKLGQELGHDAAIWKIYLEEANEHDQELVKGRHASLDMLLLFAALFSAILTAFLIESKDLLQQDPADVSAALLLSIAQSQYRMEQGLPFPTTSPLPSIPDFAPSMAARWINGIWFTSLGLSLSAALIAMLGKEWLTAYLSSRPRPAHSHALLRQSRLEGLERWWALHIIALLPSLLHASLLLFAIGLVIFLGTMDTAVAAVLTAIGAISALFYVITAVLGAIFEFCLFMTELSGYVRRATVALLKRDRVNPNPPPKYPTLKDLQALLWLANNARDPVVVDCCYQALAGLQHTIHPNLDRTAVPSSPDDQTYEIPMQLDKETTLTTLLATTTSRFNQLMAGSLDISGFSEMSAARYLRAILGISAHLSRLPDTPLDIPNQPNGAVSAQIEHKISPVRLLSTADAVWDDGSQLLSANAYADVLISTMAVIQLATPPNFSHKNEDNTHVIDIPPNETFRGDSESPLIYLRAYYSRWLARASSLLRLASETKVSVNSVLLDDLLGAMATAARCDALNPCGSRSTHHPQIETPELRTYRFVIPSNKHQSFTISPDDLRLGPLGSLINLLKEHPSVKDGSPLQTCLAALKAYSALAPVLLQQVLGLDREELRNAFNIDSWGCAPTSDMAGIRFILTRQALLTIRYLGLARGVSHHHIHFLEDVLAILNFCFPQENSIDREDSYWAIVNHSADLVPLIEFIAESGGSTFLTTNIMWNLLSVTGMPVRGVAACDNSLSPNCFPPLICMMGHINVAPDGIERLLQTMVRRMRDRKGTTRREDVPWNDIPAIEYIYPFTRTSQGFSALASAGGPEQYAEVVVKATIDIVHLAAGHDAALAVEPIELHLSAVPSFLDVVSVVAERCPKLADSDALVVQYANDVLDLLNVAAKDQASRELLHRHPGCQDLLKELARVENKGVTQGMVARFHNALVEWGTSAEISEQVEQQLDSNESEDGESDQEESDRGESDNDEDNEDGTARGEDEEA